MAWTVLLLAALFEIGWAIGLSVGLLAFAARSLPIGTAYAVWTGIGAAGTALLGVWLFHEPATVARLLCIALIVAGVVGLKWVSG
jgi:quaternary ammonium compound-resistance protein SugE